MKQIFDRVCLCLTDEVQDYWSNAPDAVSKRNLRGEKLVSLNRSVCKLVRDSVAVSIGRARKGYASIRLNANAYTESRYQKGLSYRIHVERAYRGLQALGYLRETKKGVSDGVYGRYLTRYEATNKLIDLFGKDSLNTLVVLLPAPEPIETIVVQVIETVERKEKQPLRVTTKLDYEDSDATHAMRRNVERINRLLLEHWFDLELTIAEFAELCSEMRSAGESEDAGQDANLDLSKRCLHRVFNDLNFTRGGRFYGGWWQSIPKRYRSRILIDGKRTVELDYSGLHPTILYTERDLAAPDDPYSNILPCPSGDKEVLAEYRGVVKTAFNAMLNAKKPLTRAPTGLSPKRYGTTWKKLSTAIIDAHKPIADAFYSDCGARMQRIDSDLAEGVMLHFADYATTRPPVLPVHDSFIMHHGYEDELSEVMNKLFQTRFNTTNKIGIKVKKHPYPKSDTDSSVDFFDIVNGIEARHEVALEAFRANR